MIMHACELLDLDIGSMGVMYVAIVILDYPEIRIAIHAEIHCTLYYIPLLDFHQL